MPLDAAALPDDPEAQELAQEILKNRQQPAPVRTPGGPPVLPAYGPDLSGHSATPPPTSTTPESVPSILGRVRKQTPAQIIAPAVQGVANLAHDTEAQGMADEILKTRKQNEFTNHYLTQLPKFDAIAHPAHPEEDHFLQTDTAWKHRPAFAQVPGYHPAEEGPIGGLEHSRNLSLIQLQRVIPTLEQEFVQRAKELKARDASLKSALDLYNQGKLSPSARQQLERDIGLQTAAWSAQKARAAQLTRYRSEVGNLYHTYTNKQPFPSLSDISTPANPTLEGISAGLGSITPGVAGMMRAEPKVDRARNQMMLAGQYPLPPDIPQGTPQQRQQYTKERSDLAASMRNLRPSQIEAMLGPKSAKGGPGFAGGWNKLTPYQQSIYPRLLDMAKAEERARSLAKLNKAFVVDAAAQAAGYLVGGIAGKGVSGLIASKFEPFLLGEPLAAILEARGAGAATKEFVTRGAPMVLGGAVGGGATTATTAGLIAAAEGGKPREIAKAALQAAPGGAIMGSVGAATHYLAGIAHSAALTRWDPEISPRVVENTTRQALHFKIITPEQAGEFAADLTEMGQAPTILKNGLRQKFIQKYPGAAQRGTAAPAPPAEQPAPVVKALPANALAAPPTVVEGPAEHPGPQITTADGNVIKLREHTSQQLQEIATRHPEIGPVVDAWMDHHALHEAHRSLPVPAEGQVEADRKWNNLTMPVRKQYQELEEYANKIAGDNPQAAAVIASGAHELRRDFQERFRQNWVGKNGPDEITGTTQPVMPPQQSAWRQLPAPIRATLPKSTQKTLLIQDISNSARVLNPEQASSNLMPEGVKTLEELEKQANTLFNQAQERFANNAPQSQAPEMPAESALVPTTATETPGVQVTAPVAESPAPVAEAAPGAPAPAVEAPGGVERRADTAQRQRAETMTPEQIEQLRAEHAEERRLRRTDRLSGLGNDIAWKEVPKKPHIASIDADGLGYVNDVYGHPAGDKLVAAIGNSFRQAGLGEDAFHVHGDEIMAHGEDPAELERRIQLARKIQEESTIEFPFEGKTVQLKGLSLSYGIGGGENFEQANDAAEAALKQQKAERKAAGLRASSKTVKLKSGAVNPKAKPPGLVETAGSNGKKAGLVANDGNAPQRRTNRSVEKGVGADVTTVQEAPVKKPRATAPKAEPSVPPVAAPKPEAAPVQVEAPQRATAAEATPPAEAAVASSYKSGSVLNRADNGLTLRLVEPTEKPGQWKAEIVDPGKMTGLGSKGKTILTTEDSLNKFKPTKIKESGKKGGEASSELKAAEDALLAKYGADHNVPDHEWDKLAAKIRVVAATKPIVDVGRKGGIKLSDVDPNDPRWKDADEKWHETYQAPKQTSELTFRERMAELGRWMTRAYPELPNEPQFEEFKQLLIQTGKKSIPKQQAEYAMFQYLGKLTDEQHGLLSQLQFFRDMKQDLIKGRALTAPYEPDMVDPGLQHAEMAATQDPAVWDAFKKRQAVQKPIVDERRRLVKKLAGKDLMLDEEDYLHHWILDYAEGSGIKGKPGAPVTTRGYERKREGTPLQYEKAIIESDGHWMPQMLADNQVLKLYEQVNDTLNIYDQVAAEAKAKNIPVERMLQDPKYQGRYRELRLVEGNPLWRAWTIPARIAQTIQQNAPQIIAADDLRGVLALGPKRKPMIVPVPVANTLESFSNPDNPLDRAYRSNMAEIRRFLVLNPLHIFKFGVKKIGTDVETLARNPRSLPFLSQATKDFAGFMKTKDMSSTLQKYMDLGGYQGFLAEGYGVQPTKGLDLLSNLTKRTDSKQSVPVKAWNAYFNKAGMTVTAMDSTTRYAAWLYARNSMMKNGGRPPGYGYSVPENLMAIGVRPNAPLSQEAIDLRAWKWAQDLIGNYDERSAGNRWMQQKFHILFPAWPEVNFRRYWQGARNIRINADSSDASAAAQKVMGKTGLYGMRGIQFGTFVLGALGLGVGTHLLNRVISREQEERLPEQVRSKPHITMPFADPVTGKPIVFETPGGAGELLDHFPLIDTNGLLHDLAYGNLTIKQVHERMREPWDEKLSKAFGGPKGILDAYQNARDVRSGAEQAFKRLGLGDLYKLAADIPGTRIPKEKYRQIGLVTGALGAYEFNPGDDAFIEAHRDVAHYLNDKGIQANPVITKGTQKSNAFYWYVRSLKAGDQDAALSYLSDYRIAQGDDKTLQDALIKLDPLTKLKPEETTDFVKRLNPEDQRRWTRAYQNYQSWAAPQAKLAPVGKNFGEWVEDARQRIMTGIAEQNPILALESQIPGLEKKAEDYAVKHERR